MARQRKITPSNVLERLVTIPLPPVAGGVGGKEVLVSVLLFLLVEVDSLDNSRERAFTLAWDYSSSRGIGDVSAN
jgi:hypothetical protein